MFKFDKYKICVIGLGYVGLPLALEFSKKFEVVGFDLSKSRVNSLNKNIDDNFETNSKLINKNIIFTSDDKKITNCNIYIIAVPTPIDKKNNPDISSLKKASKFVGKLIKKKDIVVIESTVYPGCTRKDCVPLIAAISNLIPNKDFYFGYSPERINPGDKIHTLTKIKKVISASDKKTLKKLNYLYGSIIKAGLHLAPSIEIAEAAKVIENTQRDLNIAFMNELSMIFDKLNIPTKDVLEASSTKWNFLNFKPGLVGGHCIGVDPYYLSHISKLNGYQPNYLISGRRVNDQMAKNMSKKIINLAKKNKISSNCNILILGLTFKENVSDIRNSKVFDIINILKKNFKNLRAYDPFVNKTDLESKYQDLLLKQKPKNLINFDIIVFAVAHKVFFKLYQNKLNKFNSRKKILVDLTLKLDRKIVDISF